MGFDAELLQQRARRLLEEQILTVVADLYPRDAGEAGIPVITDRIDNRIEIRSAGYGLGDVVRTHELRRTLEARGGRQIGVDRPAAAEPAELVVCALHGGVAGGVPADRYLPDHPDFTGQSCRPSPVVPRVDEVLVRLDGDQVVGQRREHVARAFAGHRGRDGDGRIGDVPDRAESTSKYSPFQSTR